MKLKKGLMLLALSAILFTACDKEEDDDKTPSQTKTEMLTSGSWIMTDQLIELVPGLWYQVVKKMIFTL